MSDLSNSVKVVQDALAKKRLTFNVIELSASSYDQLILQDLTGGKIISIK